MSFLLLSINNFKTDFFGTRFSLFFRLISFLFILLPFTLVTGPFLPDLFLSLIALYFLIISLINKLFNYYRNIAVYFFIAFYSCILISGLISDNPYKSLIDYNGPIFFFRYLFFVLGICYLLDTNSNLIRFFCFNLMIVLIFTIFDGFIMWGFGTNILGFQQPSARVTGIFNEEEILGHFLSHIVPLAFSLLVYIFGVRPKYIALFMLFLVVSEILIFITNDRAGFLKIFQFTLLLIFLSNRFKIFRLISFTISIMIIALILQFSTESVKRYTGTIEDVSSTKVPFMPWTPGHEEHFKISLDMFKSNPFLGKGPQAFRILCDSKDPIIGCTNHPHNYYFQTLGELGIFGFSILFISFIYISQKLLRQFSHLWFSKKNKSLFLEDHVISLYCLAFILLWPLIPHQSFYNNWLNVYSFLPFGFIIFFLKKNNPSY